MKTTPEGLTHLINMLVDVVNLQRKALGTPGATCEVRLDVDGNGKAIVVLSADVDLAAPPPPVTLEQFGGIGDPMSADNNRPLTPEEEVLEAAGFKRPSAGLR